MKKLLWFVVLLLAVLAAGFNSDAQNFNSSALLEGRWRYSDNKGYVEFSCQGGSFICYVKDEYDGRIYFGTYFYAPKLDFRNFNDQSNGTVNLNWLVGGAFTVNVTGVGSGALHVTGSHLQQRYDLRLNYQGPAQLTNQEVLQYQNGYYPNYEAQQMPTGNSAGLGASYTGKWRMTNAKGTLELSPSGVARFTDGTKTLIGKYEYLSPSFEANGSIFFYWRGYNELKCFVTKMTGQELVIEGTTGVENYRYDGWKTITKEEADRLSLSSAPPAIGREEVSPPIVPGPSVKRQTKPAPRSKRGSSNPVIPPKTPSASPGPSNVRSAVRTSVVGKWAYPDGSGYLEFSPATYFKISSTKSLDISYGTFTREWDTGKLRLHFAGRREPVYLLIRGLNSQELITESQTQLPGRMRYSGNTSLTRAEVVRVFGNDLDKQGGEGEAASAPIVCAVCHGTGLKQCSRCGGSGQITEYESRYNYNTKQYEQYPVTRSCNVCHGKGCHECDGFTCLERRAIDHFSDQTLNPFGGGCRSYGQRLVYYLVTKAGGGKKIVYHHSY